MAKEIPSWSLGEIAALIGGHLDGPSEKRIQRPVPAGSNDPDGITFAESESYLKAIKGSGVGAAIVGEQPSTTLAMPTLIVKNPRFAFFQVLSLMAKTPSLEPGIHPTAVVHASAMVHQSASVGAYVVIGEEAKIGEKSKIFPFCYIGERCVLEEQITLFPHVVLYQDVYLSPKTIVHSGAILGADGFGYFWDGQSQQKIPQAGGVKVGEKSEIGANTCIDRATCGTTEIANGVKLDNLVQVGHNVSVGAHTVVAAQTGISGSSEIGERVTMGGQVAIADHRKVASGVTLAGRSGVIHNIEEPGEYFGMPATPAGQALRILAAEQKLPELIKRVQALEAEVARLKERP